MKFRLVLLSAILCVYVAVYMTTDVARYMRGRILSSKEYTPDGQSMGYVEYVISDASYFDRFLFYMRDTVGVISKYGPGAEYYIAYYEHNILRVTCYFEGCIERMRVKGLLP